MRLQVTRMRALLMVNRGILTSGREQLPVLLVGWKFCLILLLLSAVSALRLRKTSKILAFVGLWVEQWPRFLVEAPVTGVFLGLASRLFGVHYHGVLKTSVLGRRGLPFESTVELAELVRRGSLRYLTCYGDGPYFSRLRYPVSRAEEALAGALKSNPPLLLPQHCQGPGTWEKLAANVASDKSLVALVTAARSFDLPPEVIVVEDPSYSSALYIVRNHTPTARLMRFLEAVETTLHKKAELYYQASKQVLRLGVKYSPPAEQLDTSLTERPLSLGNLQLLSRAFGITVSLCLLAFCAELAFTTRSHIVALSGFC